MRLVEEVKLLERDLDKSYLRFGDRFEREFLAQGERENRSIEQTLDLGWKILTVLPRSELYRIREEMIEKYLPSTGGAGAVGAVGAVGAKGAPA
jgi:vacuolar-type H+-ATPase subunit B/Vma2